MKRSGLRPVGLVGIPAPWDSKQAPAQQATAEALSNQLVSKPRHHRSARNDENFLSCSHSTLYAGYRQATCYIPSGHYSYRKAVLDEPANLRVSWPRFNCMNRRICK